MLFNSLHYLFFLPIVLLLYFVLPHRYRWVLLLIASSYFYMVLVPEYILVLYAIIIIDYFVGLLLERTEGRTKRSILIVSILVNIGILCAFKYTNFFVENIEDFFAFIGISLNIGRLSWILPIGLSFHTFQSLSYTFDVYAGRVKAEKHLGIYAVYVLFFPQMVAGPIERPDNLLPQLHAPQRFNAEKASTGLRLILRGLLRKVLVADNLAVLVDVVYSAPNNYSGTELMFVTWLFAIQIYCDFAGYTDMARGSAKLLGISLIENFNYPYFAKNISEFWHRWHMSLSTWFRDYVYYPLGGSKVGTYLTVRNVLIVFGLSGLWHGANWTYVVWGLAHGFLLSMYQLKQKYFPSRNLQPRNLVSEIFSWFITFQLVSLTWVFFRAKNIEDAYLVFVKIITIPGSLFASSSSWTLPVEQSLFCVGLSFLVIIFDLAAIKDVRFRNAPVMVRWASYVAAIVLIVLVGQLDQRQFIYFQF